MKNNKTGKVEGASLPTPFGEIPKKLKEYYDSLQEEAIPARFIDLLERLDHADVPSVLLRQAFNEMLSDWPDWGSVIRVDIQAYYDRDPVCMVIGETAVVGDNVSILQGVTLGGTGKESGDRHPKVGDSVLIGAGAKVLGNIEIGKCSRIAAGSVVLKPVPPKTTVAGVPARIVGEAGCSEPSRSMDQILSAIE